MPAPSPGRAGQVDSNGITLAIERHGPPAAPQVLLIAGMGEQLIDWDERFVARLTGLGYGVVRFDNRDSGLSTKCADAGVPDLAALLAGDASSAAYRIGDLADDTAGLLDGLGLDSAHLVGRSMGGMVVQEMLLRHPHRVRTATSIMSTTGDADLPGSDPDAGPDWSAGIPTDRAGWVRFALEGARQVAGPGFGFGETAARAAIEAAYDRCFCPEGHLRQFAAFLATPGRGEALRQVAVPTLVVHGDADPLVSPAAGLRTAARIPGSELVIVAGMGHDLPPGVWDRILDPLARLLRGAGAPSC